MHACMYVCMFMHTCAMDWWKWNIHTYINTYIHTYIHTYPHTYIHKYIHTYIHTYIHQPVLRRLINIVNVVINGISSCRFRFSRLRRGSRALFWREIILVVTITIFGRFSREPAFRAFFQLIIAVIIFFGRFI